MAQRLSPFQVDSPSSESRSTPRATCHLFPTHILTASRLTSHIGHNLTPAKTLFECCGQQLPATSMAVQLCILHLPITVRNRSGCLETQSSSVIRRLHLLLPPPLVRKDPKNRLTFTTTASWRRPVPRQRLYAVSQSNVDLYLVTSQRSQDLDRGACASLSAW